MEMEKHPKCGAVGVCGLPHGHSGLCVYVEHPTPTTLEEQTALAEALDAHIDNFEDDFREIPPDDNDYAEADRRLRFLRDLRERLFGPREPEEPTQPERSH